ncbi:MAG: lipase family protein, partial [Akkermansiaceae bacterium]|nr:lipase family protein [Akkermansiaceae bacterium]
TLSRELDELRWMLEQTAAGDLLPRSPDAVGLVGHSRGGAQAILAAAEDPR